ncbi:hypothetical protein AV530_008560 [Patagioenas fasciata monilis]|uniref:Uncharacterized protein n=1 Tax=Patagioenas fasciata monilis TaxID=372326 RepID=A0A1V4JW15_PATFA|nr:hypothetical protein AV530_008560 [Patagioenas fasciata monilis]
MIGTYRAFREFYCSPADTATHFWGRRTFLPREEKPTCGNFAQMNDSPGCVVTPGTKKELLPEDHENAICPDLCPGSGCGAVQSHGCS